MGHDPFGIHQKEENHNPQGTISGPPSISPTCAGCWTSPRQTWNERKNIRDARRKAMLLSDDVAGHLLVMGGMIHDTSNSREGEVWRVGPYLWGHHRHDPRLCMGWLDHQEHDPKDGRRGALGGSGG